jgi:acetolactate synthase-1/2/3 large subunit
MTNAHTSALLAEPRRVTGAQALVRTLEDVGVRHIFGYPGGAIMPVYDALIESSLIHLLCRHEQGCALAADGYARVSGEVGVCLATSGPGATNLVTGIANAYMDSVPLLAITGQVPTTVMGTDAFQEVDIFGITMPVVKHSFIIRNADDIQATVLDALEIAASGRPGPVLIDLPKDVANASCNYRHSVMTTHRPSPQQYGLADLHRAEELLRRSRRPVAYIGGGTVISRSHGAVRRFVEHHGIPSVATLKAIGALPTDSELYLGMIGMHGTRAAFDDRVTGKLDEFAPNARVLHIDIDPAEISKLRNADVSLPGEIAPVMRHLTDLPAIGFPQWLSHCQSMVKDCQFDYGYPGDDIFAPLFLRRMGDEVTRHAGRAPVISCDVGQHQMWVAQHCPFDSPEHHLSSSGLGTMGFGLPAAIGAQIACPDQPVVVVSGDGSIMMNLQELATLKRYDLPVRIIVLDNACLGMVRQWQELFFDERFSEVDLSDNPDFAAVARSFGLTAMTIRKADEIDAGIEFLKTTTGPCLLHVRIDPRANVWPLVPPGKGNHEMMEKAFSDRSKPEQSPLENAK